MKLSSIFKNRKVQTSWKWPLFKHLKTILFQTKDNMLKNAYSILSNTIKFVSVLDSSWSQLRYSIETTEDSEGELLEMAVKPLRSDRLSFESGNTSSILDAATYPFKDCVALDIEYSEDPYVDFRISMKEVVETCGLKSLEHLEDLLAWYLRFNRKKNHGFIVVAFFDMFAGITGIPSLSVSIMVLLHQQKSRNRRQLVDESIPSFVETGNYPKDF